MNRTFKLIIAIVFVSACVNQSDKQHMSNENNIVFTDSSGNSITKEELKNSNGSFQYEILGSDNVSEQAKSLHNEARNLASLGSYEQAIFKFKDAIKYAPSWPYPVYDLAYTYLLLDDDKNALKYYQLTDSLAPKGYFTSKTALHTLLKEQSGEFKKGLYRAYLSLESIPTDIEKKEMSQLLITNFPKFAPGWKEYSNYLDGEERKRAINTALMLDCDIQTQGSLLINKAMILENEGNTDEAIQILSSLILSSKSTFGNIELAKFMLNNFVSSEKNP